MRFLAFLDNTTVTMWMGIAFVLLGLTAVLLQAWLWNPRYWDPVNHKTRAPKYGLFMHRWVGFAFLLIYVLLMIEMVPRLWQYQVELPARTVMHATAGIALGILLFTKIAILWFWRHFEESMPALGFGILVCTLLLGILSIPFAIQAQGLGSDAFESKNLERVERLMARIEWEQDVAPSELTKVKSLSRGRRILVDDCVRCHDMRTILAKPRTSESWYSTVMRMTEKPSVFGPTTALEDVPYVTAYLVAITPEIQESRKELAKQQKLREDLLSGLGIQDGAKSANGGAAAVAAATATVSKEEGDAMLQEYCTGCHELSPEITEYKGDVAAWTKVMADMVEEGAEVPPEKSAKLIAYLAQTYPG